MKKRKITDTLNLKFEPFDRYGPTIPGMSWHKISFDKKMVMAHIYRNWSPELKQFLILTLVLKNFLF